MDIAIYIVSMAVAGYVFYRQDCRIAKINQMLIDQKGHTEFWKGRCEALLNERCDSQGVTKHIEGSAV